MYRLTDYFGFLTYNLGTPLLLVTLLKNLSVRRAHTARACPLPALARRAAQPCPPLLPASPQLTFFVANFEACAFYFVALLEGFSSNTWVGQLNSWLGVADTSHMYLYSLYWAVITISTTG